MHDPLTKDPTIDPATRADNPPLIPVADSPIVIGRSAAATLRLLHPTVSRKHATISRTIESFTVEDHDSRFGTFVNGARVRAATLRAGDRVQFGSAIAYRVDPAGLRLDVMAEGMTLAADALCVSISESFNFKKWLGELRSPRIGKLVSGTERLDRKPLLQDIHLDIRPDSFTGILGPSGSGKSTLLNCLASYGAPDQGRLWFDGRRDAFAEVDAYREAMGHVPQDDVVFRSLTVRENLSFAARLRLGRKPGGGDLDAAIGQALERVDLVEHADKPVAVLSGGQRKRLSVAIELLRRPRLLLLDEPTSGLDPASEAHLMEQLRHVARRGTTVVCTTHLMDNLRLLDEVVVLGVVAGVGRLAYSGPPDGLLPHFECRGFADLYELLASGRFEPLISDSRASSNRVDRPATSETSSGPSGVGPPKSGLVAATKPFLARPAIGRLAANLAADTGLAQFLVIGRRAIQITLRDRGLILAMIAQPVVLGGLVALAQYDASKPLPILFFAVVIALWLGLNNSARDLVSERRHYVRDRLAGLDPAAYLGAKSLVHAMFGLGQIAILLLVLRVGCRLVLDPHAARAFGDSSSPSLVVVLILTYLGGVGLGLLVSALVRTEAAAVAALPLLIMPQLLISVVATGFQDESYTKARPFRPLVVTLTSRQELRRPAALVDRLSMICLSRPAALVAESPVVGTFGRWIWLGDLCHLMILLLGIWTLVFLAFGQAERRWLRLLGL